MANAIFDRLLQSNFSNNFTCFILVIAEIKGYARAYQILHLPSFIFKDSKFLLRPSMPSETTDHPHRCDLDMLAVKEYLHLL